MYDKFGLAHNQQWMKGTAKMKKWLQEKILYPLLDKLPRGMREKIKMAGTCLFGNGWGYLILSRPCDILKVSADEIKKLYAGLSDHSLEILLTYYKYAELAAYFAKNLDMQKNNVIIVPLKQLFPGVEEKTEKEEKLCRKIRREVPFDYVLPEVFYYHHGLKFLDAGVRDYIENTVFLDLGAFIGDSTYVLAQYKPSKIIAFEPSKQNCNEYISNLQHEKIQNFELFQMGIAERPGRLSLDDNGLGSSFTENGGNDIDVVSVDGFLEQHDYGKIGLIKADLEGMGLQMVKGALETIKRDRPVLLLGIYHNADEFTGIYALLKDELQGYHYQVEALSSFYEITLLAWPEEVVKKA